MRLLDYDNVVAAANFTVALGLIILAVVSIQYAYKAYKQNRDDIKYILAGVSLEAVAWSIHRVYWGVARAIQGPGDNSFYLLLTKWWLTTISIYMVAITGIILILTPVWKIAFGSQWKWIPFAGLMAFWWFAYVMLMTTDLSPEALGIKEWVDRQLRNDE